MDRLMKTIAAETAVELERFCVERGLTNANERDHLAPCCACTTAGVIKREAPPPSTDSHACGDGLGWVGLGHVDVVLRWPGRATFLELKCGSDLTDCVWDAVKLSAALLNGNCDSAYLLAGAPRTTWAKPKHGTELFVDGTWETLGPKVRDAYAKRWWDMQEERRRTSKGDSVPYRPSRHLPGLVATTFDTELLGSWPMTIGLDAWELRLARIDVPDAEWAMWECVSNPRKASPTVV